MKRGTQVFARLALAGFGLAIAAGTAQAQGWTSAQQGKIRVKSGAISNFIFSDLGDGVGWQEVGATSATAAMEIGFGTDPTAWFDLLGIHGIWRVNPNTGETEGSASNDGNYVDQDGDIDNANEGFWSVVDKGYSAGNGGYDDSDPWIRLAGDSILSYYGKGGLTPYDRGSFVWLDLDPDSVLGIDYLIGTGQGQTQSGRVYFSDVSAPQGGGGRVEAVPEPGEWAAMGVLGAGVVGLIVRKRRQR